MNKNKNQFRLETVIYSIIRTIKNTFPTSSLYSYADFHFRTPQLLFVCFTNKQKRENEYVIHSYIFLVQNQSSAKKRQKKERKMPWTRTIFKLSVGKSEHKENPRAIRSESQTNDEVDDEELMVNRIDQYILECHSSAATSAILRLFVFCFELTLLLLSRRSFLAKWVQRLLLHF